ncbi:MAG: crotonobetainyl-CoA:carnitine CoA-transferase CaiB-like acyl-CoA transferase [Saprospiraceae bacterium]|jgi:crotonobetainyl-CoA:carnitine CoA-transferase CaiB-like acyl-CoA transferase
MSTSGPLSKYRVLDLSRILAGPWASQMLADFGAEVIKIERPVVGDDTRTWGPPFIGDVEEGASAAYFHAVNRNKQSVAIDITTSEGQGIVRQLAAKSDVVLENFKVGGLAKYGLDYESLCAVNPTLVYCSITGFGQTGPYKDRAGYDFMIQAMGGLMSVTGETQGLPMKVGVAITDISTGMYAANAIQAALLHREHTGEGQYIDLSLLDVQVATLANQAMNYLASGVSPTRMGNSHPNIVPYQAFATADGHIILAIGNDSQFRAFCELAKCSELGSDARFAGNADRVRNREDLVLIIQAIMAEQDNTWWLENLNQKGVPCGPINTIEEVFADPQVQHRETEITMQTARGGAVSTVANPVKFSKTPVSYDRCSPELGQDSTSCLLELTDFDETQLATLKDNGIIG